MILVLSSTTSLTRQSRSRVSDRPSRWIDDTANFQSFLFLNQFLIMGNYPKEYATIVKFGFYSRTSGILLSYFFISSLLFQTRVFLNNFIILRDANTNPLLVRNMKLTKRYKKCLEDIEEFPHGYTVINNSPLLECESLRVSTNIFGENKQISNFPIFYPKN